VQGLRLPGAETRLSPRLVAVSSCLALRACPFGFFPSLFPPWATPLQASQAPIRGSLRFGSRLLVVKAPRLGRTHLRRARGSIQGAGQEMRSFL